MSTYSYGAYQSGGIGSQYSHHSEVTAESIQKKLKPFLDLLREYDEKKRKLEREGGEINDYKGLVEILHRQLPYTNSFGRGSYSLIRQDRIKSFLRSVSYSLHFDVRVNEHELPMYFICRTKSDYWREYDLVVEDIYRSYDYKFKDERFVSLMEMGHENQFLRLSSFRSKVNQQLFKKEEATLRELDSFLHKLGRHIFQSIWHEDQRVGFQISTYLGMPEFTQAIELLYLCLGGDLCETRAVIDENVIGFFERIYPHPPIMEFLHNLISVDGKAINSIPMRAERLYVELMEEFRTFLATLVRWSSHSFMVPVWKVFFSNINDLEKVCKVLKFDIRLQRKVESIRSTALRIISEINSGEE